MREEKKDTFTCVVCKKVQPRQNESYRKGVCETCFTHNVEIASRSRCDYYWDDCLGDVD